MTYTYRVFIEADDANTDAMHYASEKVYEGAIFRVNKPGTLIHGRQVIIYQVDNIREMKPSVSLTLASRSETKSSSACALCVRPDDPWHPWRELPRPSRPSQ